MYFKKMSGKLCYLSPIDVNDAEQFTAWLNDMDVTKNLPFYSAVVNSHTEKSILEKISQDHVYSIIDNAANELIGNCGYKSIDHVNQNGEIGIFIGSKKHWSKGYGTEALSLLLDYGFKALNLHNIFLKLYSCNDRALACYKKIGFKLIGIQREAMLRDRKRHDYIFMDILPDDFYGKLDTSIIDAINITKG